MSVEVPIPQLFDDVESWGFCYLLTVSADARPHALALRPEVVGAPDALALQMDAGGGGACRNAERHADVTLVFPPHAASKGMSLIVDGRAAVAGPRVTVTPTWAVLHRAAP